MTQVAEPGAVHTDSPAPGRVSHWIGGRSVAGTSGREGPVYDPATGRLTRHVDFASVEEVDAAVAAAKAAFPAWRATSLSKRTEIMFRIRNLVEPHRQELAAHLTAEHGKVPSDALGEIARGLENLEFATRHPEPAQGRLLASRSRPGSTSTRSASRSASWPASRRSTSRRWSRCGCSRTRSRAATRSSSSRPRRTRRRRSSSPSCSPRRASRTASSTSSTATRSRSTRSSSTPTSPPSASSARRRSPATSTRPARGTASASRRSAARRTTWSCCPTPTSRWPPTRPSRPATARPASAAWRSRRSSPSGDVADPLVEAIEARLPKIKVGPGQRPEAEMGPLVTREHRDKVASYLETGPAQGATLVADGREHPLYKDERRLLPRRLAHRPRDARRWTATATRSSARC